MVAWFLPGVASKIPTEIIPENFLKTYRNSSINSTRDVVQLLKKFIYGIL